MDREPFLLRLAVVSAAVAAGMGGLATSALIYFEFMSRLASGLGNVGL